MNADRFAVRLKELREGAGLTQQNLADDAGLKLGGIRDLEQGRRKPAWETVLALCKALGVDCTAFTVEPSSSPAAEAPRRGRPRKVAPSTETPVEPLEEKKPAKGRAKRKEG